MQCKHPPAGSNATSDDRPYFANFFRWQSLREILALREVGGAALVEWSYPLLVMTFAQAFLAGLLLIILPIALVRRTGRGMSSVILYFGAIGFGFMFMFMFMFIEIGFIQKLVLLLGHPLYSIPLVLASFLVFAGMGSRVSERLTLAQARLPFIGLFGVRRIAASAESWIPWGWAVNGSASVAGAVLATIIAVHAGFTILIVAALALYLVAASVRFE